MREHRLLQRHRPLGRRRRPGFFRVERPDQLWHMDMTAVWVAEHGWCYLNAIIDCCTREITGWSLDVRCRAKEAAAVVDRAVAARAIQPGELTLGTDNGTALTARAFRAQLAEARHHAPSRRLPRPREPGLHRELVLETQAALRLARGVRDPRRRSHRDRRVHRALSRPTPQPAGLPHPARGRGDLEGSRRPANPSGLTVNAHGVHATRPLPRRTGRDQADLPRDRTCRDHVALGARLDSRPSSPQDPLRRPIPRLTMTPVASASHTERRTVSSGRHDKRRPRPHRSGSMETSQPAESTLSRSH